MDKNDKDNKTKKPIYKKWWFWLIIVIVFVGGGRNNKPELDTKQDNVATEDNEKLADEVEEVDNDIKDDAEETLSDEDKAYWDSVKSNIVGVSDKDYSDVQSPKPYTVRGDSSDRFKNVVISQGIDVVDYAVSYYDMYMDEDEVHYIVDFGRNTTSSIHKTSGLIYVDVMEYTEKEEHDVKKIGSGMVLGNYKIYYDGDIEKLDYE